MIDKMRLRASERRFLTLDLQVSHSDVLFEASGTATRITLAVLFSAEMFFQTVLYSGEH